MNNKFYPYIWYIEYKKIKDISYRDYIPYFELSLDGFNAGKNAYVNLDMLNIFFKNGIDENLCTFYIKLLAKVRYMSIYSKMYLYKNNLDYRLLKWEYKSLYIKDSVYIFFSCIKEFFKSHIIYRKYNTFYIILDYEKTFENESNIKIIIDKFLPLGLRAVYLFDHFLFLDIEELSKLERWVAIWNIQLS